MKPRVPRDKDGVRLYNPERSCKDCYNYPCIAAQEQCLADFAKYGCVLYYDKLNRKSKTSG